MNHPWEYVMPLASASFHPVPWQVRKFGYERYALLDANQAEIGEFVYEWDAQQCAELVNASRTAAPKRPLPWWQNQELARGAFYGVMATFAFQVLCVLLAEALRR
jgi:hypothetical protein